MYESGLAVILKVGVQGIYRRVLTRSGEKFKSISYLNRMLPVWAQIL